MSKTKCLASQEANRRRQGNKQKCLLTCGDKKNEAGGEDRDRWQGRGPAVQGGRSEEVTFEPE